VIYLLLHRLIYVLEGFVKTHIEVKSNIISSILVFMSIAISDETWRRWFSMSIKPDPWDRWLYEATKTSKNSGFSKFKAD